MVGLERRSWELERPVRTSKGTWHVRESLLVHVEGPGGFEGVGEAAPLVGYSPDTLIDVEHGLAAVREVEVCGLDPDGWGGVKGLGALPSARFALESAVLRSWALQEGVTVSALLGWRDGPVPVSQMVSGPTDGWIAKVSEGWRRGVRTHKFKVGVDWEGEWCALQGIRARWGAAIRIRLDANGADPSKKVGLRDALVWGQRCSGLGVEYVEEPGGDRAIWKGCCIALDESLGTVVGPWGVGDLRSLMGAGVGVVVLKPSVLGGMHRSIAVARQAARFGCASVVSHTLEGTVGQEMCAVLARGIGGALAHGVESAG